MKVFKFATLAVAFVFLAPSGLSRLSAMNTNGRKNTGALFCGAECLAQRYSNVWRREGSIWRKIARHANVLPLSANQPASRD